MAENNIECRAKRGEKFYFKNIFVNITWTDFFFLNLTWTDFFFLEVAWTDFLFFHIGLDGFFFSNFDHAPPRMINGPPLICSAEIQNGVPYCIFINIESYFKINYLIIADY